MPAAPASPCFGVCINGIGLLGAGARTGSIFVWGNIICPGRTVGVIRSSRLTGLKLSAIKF